jgi:apolipoprotein N-acyltransferase
VKQQILKTPRTLLFCSGCFSALAMAPVYAWPLMAIGYSILTYVIYQSHSWKQAFTYGFVFFFGYFLSSLYWISSSLFVEIETWWWALPLSFAGLPFLLSLIPAVCLTPTAMNKKFKLPLIIIMLCVADFFRGHILTGFPWNMPAHGWVQTELMMSILPHIGFYGLNSLTIILFCLPALILTLKAKTKIFVGVTYASLLCLLFFPFEIKTNTQSLGSLDNIIMVQANIPQTEKWNADYIDRNLDRYITMSEDAIISRESHIIIWPETAISQNLLSYPDLQNQFYQFLNTLPKGSLLITGYLYQNADGFYNAMAILDTNGEIIDIYNKHHLVPFGEYMPFNLGTLTGVSGFQTGEKPRIINLPSFNFNILPQICYEIIFSRYARAVNNNALILNITNDAWFGETAGPYQHFDHAIFRARETGRPVLRLSGNGISGLISGEGLIYSATLLNEQKTVAITKYRSREIANIRFF